MASETGSLWTAHTTTEAAISLQTRDRGCKAHRAAGFRRSGVDGRRPYRSKKSRYCRKSLWAGLASTHQVRAAIRASCSCQKIGRSMSRVSVLMLKFVGCEPVRTCRTSVGDRNANRIHRLACNLSMPSCRAIWGSDFTSPILTHSHQQCALATASINDGSLRLKALLSSRRGKMNFRS